MTRMTRSLPRADPDDATRRDADRAAWDRGNAGQPQLVELVD
jgi:hypothetical protein